MDHPRRDDLLDELARLDGDTNSYAILSRDDLTYIQTCGSPQDGFDIEYQAGSLDAHYRAAGGPFALSTIATAFQSYAVDNDDWREMFDWEKVDVAREQRCGMGRLIMFLLGIAGVSLYVLGSL